MAVIGQIYDGPFTSDQLREQFAAQARSLPRVTLPPLVSESWTKDPKHLGFVLARYKFVAKMLTGLGPVAEIGAGEDFASRIVAQEVTAIHRYDKIGSPSVAAVDICRSELPLPYRAIYAIDVLEHIPHEQRPSALTNIRRSLTPNGIFIAGCPSLESQKYANGRSRDGHVSCMSGEQFRTELKEHFDNVFMFSMHDEVVTAAFLPMAHYLFALCVGPR
jgi:hypothetical protein